MRLCLFGVLTIALVLAFLAAIGLLADLTSLLQMLFQDRRLLAGPLLENLILAVLGLGFKEFDGQFMIFHHAIHVQVIELLTLGILELVEHLLMFFIHGLGE